MRIDLLFVVIVFHTYTWLSVRVGVDNLHKLVEQVINVQTALRASETAKYSAKVKDAIKVACLRMNQAGLEENTIS